MPQTDEPDLVGVPDHLVPAIRALIEAKHDLKMLKEPTPELKLLGHEARGLEVLQAYVPLVRALQSWLPGVDDDAIARLGGEYDSISGTIDTEQCCEKWGCDGGTKALRERWLKALYAWRENHFLPRWPHLKAVAPGEVG